MDKFTRQSENPMTVRLNGKYEIMTKWFIYDKEKEHFKFKHIKSNKWNRYFNIKIVEVVE